jgi:hypothetical protein
MSARSSATVCKQRVSDGRVTDLRDWEDLAGSDPFDEGCGATQMFLTDQDATYDAPFKL